MAIRRLLVALRPPSMGRRRRLHVSTHTPPHPLPAPAMERATPVLLVQGECLRSSWYVVGLAFLLGGRGG
jgi:hypothetical protein